MTAELLAAGSTEADKAAPLGLFVILALAVATFFLVRSMIKQVKKVPPSFDGRDDHGNAVPKLGEALPREDPAIEDFVEPVPHAAQTPPRLGTPNDFDGPASKMNVGSRAHQKAKLRSRKQQLKAKKSARRLPDKTAE